MLPKDENITVTFEQGGMFETLETGIYPENLVICSEKYQTTWKRKATNGRSKGTLKVNGVKVYRFQFNGKGFLLQAFVEGNPDGDWETVEVVHMLCD